MSSYKNVIAKKCVSSLSSVQYILLKTLTNISKDLKNVKFEKDLILFLISFHRGRLNVGRLLYTKFGNNHFNEQLQQGKIKVLIGLSEERTFTISGM